MCACSQISCFPGWPCSHRRRATVEVNLRWNRLLTASLLASSASYLLISWQKPSRFFATTVEYFIEYFKFSWCHPSTWVEQKFSRKNFRGLLKICKHRESFLTIKLLSFTVYCKQRTAWKASLQFIHSLRMIWRIQLWNLCLIPW